ncbi:3'-5' exonuclease [Arthrobacter roseus]|uniref:3'-5' exonuclease n=1 Tax=Arthrobacter roseus TaxID=136274 RepID=UPI001965F786|nr:3'-5' exonuclease [Arthrobacter roseus]MBM7849158.1 DNA polymerase-3 subunit epsilon [Arthrobacter roseus]
MTIPTNWHELPRAAFDLETTGQDPLEARIVTASVVLVNGRGDVLQHHEWLANPGIPIPDEAANIHGVNTATASASGAPADEVAGEICAILGGMFTADIPVMAFNACYDFTVLSRECGRHSQATITSMPVIDPYILDKQMDRYRRGKRTLTALSELYGVPHDNAHTSAADVMATLGVASALAEKYPELHGDATELHHKQTGWASQQAASFQEYLRRKNPSAVIDGSWPHIPHETSVTVP